MIQSLVPKWPILVLFCRMDHQKSNFSLISDTLSVGGSWGQQMLLFWKLVDETQMPKPTEAPRHHNSKIFIDPSTPQSHSESYISIWDTLYAMHHVKLLKFPSHRRTTVCRKVRKKTNGLGITLLFVEVKRKKLVSFLSCHKGVIIFFLRFSSILFASSPTCNRPPDFLPSWWFLIFFNIFFVLMFSNFTDWN